MQTTSTNPYDLTGQVAIVTGASRGIGAAVAGALAASGARVVLASRKQEGVEAIAELIRSHGGDALAVACHTGRAQDCEALAARAQEAYGGIDILVNNAATSPHFGPLLEAEESHWDKTIEVNVKGYVHMIRSCVPRMKERGGGRVVNVASVAGMFPHNGLGVYGVTKAAVIMLTRTLGMELAKENVRVNAIAPGLIRTRFSEVLWSSPERQEKALASIPQGRLGEPDDLTGAVLYLASQASGFTTGSVMVIDGGQTLGLAY
ncbi:MAG TPA: glucose 1-dehydrogenase [Thermoanaerobaculia bacterium]|nr:glucose 1-dehydrogenase [Thermoanaerobaculia bacterium]